MPPPRISKECRELTLESGDSINIFKDAVQKDFKEVYVRLNEVRNYLHNINDVLPVMFPDNVIRDESYPGRIWTEDVVKRMDEDLKEGFRRTKNDDRRNSRSFN